jgi:hypothetical protein
LIKGKFLLKHIHLLVAFITIAILLGLISTPQAQNTAEQQIIPQGHKFRTSMQAAQLSFKNTWPAIVHKTTSTKTYQIENRLKQQQFINAPAQLNPTVYRLAIKAYDYATRHHDISHANIITIIDYSLPSNKKRLWVINLTNHTTLFHTLVAHGIKSGNNFAQNFSNKPGSLESSIGVFETGCPYYGKHGYSLRLYGLEKGINSNAYKRSIVMHKAWYVSKAMIHRVGRLGRSWGCPAVSEKVSKSIIQTIKNGSLLFVYYPDKHWLKTSEFL